jgi:hypothetical protein
MAMSRRTYPVSELIPDGYRAKRLPDEIREWVDEQAQKLNEGYYQHEIEPDAQIGGFRKKRDSQLSDGGWNWFGEGSERTVGGLGNTVSGSPIYETFERVVVKFNFTTRPIDSVGLSRDEKEQAWVNGGNIHEIAVWKWACDHDDEDLFATILDYSEYGDWMVQEYCIPIYPNSQRPSHARNGAVDYLSSKKLPRQYERKATSRGYNPHIKDGNIGYDQATKTPVCIDAGDHFKIDGVDAEGLVEHTLQ